jgi:hypothetical protein
VLHSREYALLEYLDTLGVRRDAFTAVGARVYLYDLSR